VRDRQTKRILNVGAGSRRDNALLSVLSPPDWSEVRIDIDRRTAPNVVGSFADMRGLIEDRQFDAIWSSHSIEHLCDHEVLPAFLEFKRVLRKDGFAIVSCPNLHAIAKLLAVEDIDSVVYLSPAGPIRVLDMIYGHAPLMRAGHAHMAHKTGFTSSRLGRIAAEAGFAETRVMEGHMYDLWAALIMDDADLEGLAQLFARTRISALFSPKNAESPRSRKRVGARLQIVRG
jgi:SAM-dependent methyltransferase